MVASASTAKNSHPVQLKQQRPASTFGEERSSHGGSLRPKPRVADDEVHGGRSGTRGHIDARIQAELSRELVAKAHPATADALLQRPVGALGPCAARATEG